MVSFLDLSNDIARAWETEGSDYSLRRELLPGRGVDAARRTFYSAASELRRAFCMHCRSSDVTHKKFTTNMACELAIFLQLVSLTAFSHSGFYGDVTKKLIIL